MSKESINDWILVILLAVFAFIGATSASAKVYEAPTKEVVEFTDSTTSDIYKIKDKEYPIYKSKKGRLYIWKISKNTNKPYKYYLPKEVQQQIEENNKLLDKNNK